MLLPKTNQEDLGGARGGGGYPPSRSPHAGIHLRDARATRKDPESGQTWAKQEDWPETNLVTLQPETASSMESGSLGSLNLLLSACLPLPNKVSCFISMGVFSDDSFLSVRQEPTLRPWQGSLFLQQHCGRCC